MEKHNFKQILDVIDILTGPDGCSWDQQQTPKSLCDYLVEESFELVEAIQSNDLTEISEELGDVLFLVLFIGRYLDKVSPNFLQDVLTGNAQKMIRRHPHVFQKSQCNGEKVNINWEEIKKQEKIATKQDLGIFSSLPQNLPPLLKAYRINSKAAKIGFTWTSNGDQEAKLQEEWTELQQALFANFAESKEEEFGDYLFSLVEYGRRRGIKANTALSLANTKFLQRFQAMEDLAFHRGLDLSAMTLEEMDILWSEVKKSANKKEPVK